MQEVVNVGVNVDVEVQKVDAEPVNNEAPVEETTSTGVKFEDLEEMSVKSLQELCREYKLKVKGRKDELIERIKEYLSVDKL